MEPRSLETESRLEMRVLVVELERSAAAYLARALVEESFAVDIARDGAAALEMASEHHYDVIVLDLMLPGLDGLAVCRRLRERHDTTPVVMVSAQDTVEDRVRGLDAGADDYLGKPFAIEELLARIRALLRRPPDSTQGALVVGDLQLDPETRSAIRGGRHIQLTGREYALLQYLMRRPGVVRTRTMIAEQIWESPFDHASNVVDVYVKHLRDKIDEPNEPSLIQAVRGVGYVLKKPPSAGSSS